MWPAMVRRGSGTTATSRPSKGLDRGVIVQAAIRSIDRSGTQGLSMRGLGQQLGVEGMALYRYVAGREDLLEAVVCTLLDGLAQDLDKNLVTTWHGYLQAFAQAVRQIAVQHPAAFPLVATRHPAAHWLRMTSAQLTSEDLTSDGRQNRVQHLAGRSAATPFGR
jgi:AcrR family transcriptional regulator